LNSHHSGITEAEKLFFIALGIVTFSIVTVALLTRRGRRYRRAALFDEIIATTDLGPATSSEEELEMTSSGGILS